MSLAHFAYVAPKSLSEALSLLAARKADARVLAGGTDLLPKIGNADAGAGLIACRKEVQGDNPLIAAPAADQSTLQACDPSLLAPCSNRENRDSTAEMLLVSLRRIAELRGIVYDRKHGLTIGATARVNELLAHEAVRRHYPAMVDAASRMATVQIRNMATVAGNICNARPCADNVPTLVARAARVELLSVRGSRTLDLENFILAPGKTAIEPDELLVKIHVPAPPAGSGASYQCASARCKVDLTSVSVAVYLVCEDAAIRQARIVLGAVGPVPLRARKAEDLLVGQPPTESLLAEVAEAAASESRPITDIRASAEWRRKMVHVLTKRAILEAANRAGGKP
jgi:CO/xanthine dehydrogenase FAD-binding subunit